MTGAARGIGRAIAAAFARDGDRVAVHYSTSADDARATVDGLPGSGHVLVAGDLTGPRSLDEVVDTAVAGLGGIDVLVNNAAVITDAHPLPGTSAQEWRAAFRRTFDVNVLAVADVCHRVATHMVERGVGGRIVNVGSRGAFRGEADRPAYGASKAALHALGQSLALSLAPYGISVASVAPGFVETDQVAELLAAQPGIRAQSPFGRVARPEEIAAAVRYLASSEALWSSGAVLDVNGASYLRT